MLIKVSTLILIGWFCLIVRTEARNRLMNRGKYGALGLPKVDHFSHQLRAARIEPQWFEQKLDHFNPQNTQTWKQVSSLMQQQKGNIINLKELLFWS
jgi:hypothetical protein